jgi:hypothetical protein
MITIDATAGGIILDNGYPPTMVLVIAESGRAKILRIDNPEETLDDLLRESQRLQTAHRKAKRETCKRIRNR